MPHQRGANKAGAAGDQDFLRLNSHECTSLIKREERIAVIGKEYFKFGKPRQARILVRQQRLQARHGPVNRQIRIIPGNAAIRLGRLTGRS